MSAPGAALERLPGQALGGASPAGPPGLAPKHSQGSSHGLRANSEDSARSALRRGDLRGFSAIPVVLAVLRPSDVPTQSHLEARMGFTGRKR